MHFYVYIKGFFKNLLRSYSSLSHKRLLSYANVNLLHFDFGNDFF